MPAKLSAVIDTRVTYCGDNLDQLRKLPEGCVELHRVLKKTGSFYYHCDWHASHYVKVMLDQTPLSTTSAKPGADELALEERFYALQVKQKVQNGRPDIDAFETAMRRAKCEKGFFVRFDYSGDAMREIDRFSREEHRIIVPLTVREILNEEIARKFASN
jgi:hypothetical protein